MTADIAYVYVFKYAHKTSLSFAKSVTNVFYGLYYNLDKPNLFLFEFLKLIYYSIKIPKHKVYLVCNSFSLLCVCFKKIFSFRKIVIIHRVNDNIYEEKMHSILKNMVFSLAYKNVDLFISCSPFISGIIKKKNVNSKICEVNEFLSDKRYLNLNPNYKSSNFLLIGSIEKNDCKGTLLSAKSIYSAYKKLTKNLNFFILGPVLNKNIEFKLNKFDFVKIKGFQDPKKYVSLCKYYIQPGLFDAASNSIIEAMASGLIVITNERVGNSFMVCKVSKKLVSSKNTIEDIANIIIWLNSLSEDKIKKLSEKSKKIASYYSEERQVNLFRDEVFHYLKFF